MKIKNPNQETALSSLKALFPQTKVEYRAGQVNVWSPVINSQQMHTILSVASENQLKPEFTRSGEFIRASLK